MQDDPPDVVTPAELGRAIRAVRLASGLTQAQASALCGVSAPFLSDLERGKATAQIGAILAVCHGLGIHIRLLAPMKVAQESTRQRVRRIRSVRRD